MVIERNWEHYYVKPWKWEHIKEGSNEGRYRLEERYAVKQNRRIYKRIRMSERGLGVPRKLGATKITKHKGREIRCLRMQWMGRKPAR
jgi:hypothetical protein